MIELSLEVHNRLVDQSNAGRQLIKYTRHFPYCLERVEPNSSNAISLMRTCTCGLAETVARAFGLAT